MHRSCLLHIFHPYSGVEVVGGDREEKGRRDQVDVPRAQGAALRRGLRANTGISPLLLRRQEDEAL